MKIRRIDKNGDYTLGHGDACFYVDSAAGVAQNVITRLSLWAGTWFLDKDAGTPWLGKILGKSRAAEALIKDRILQTPGVNSITQFSTTFDPDKRRLIVTATISTPYGATEISRDFYG